MLDYMWYIVLVCFIMIGAIKAAADNPSLFNKLFSFVAVFNAVSVIGAVIKIVYR